MRHETVITEVPAPSWRSCCASDTPSVGQSDPLWLPAWARSKIPHISRSLTRKVGENCCGDTRQKGWMPGCLRRRLQVRLAGQQPAAHRGGR